MTVQPPSEASIITHIQSSFSDQFYQIKKGIGDDCAVIERDQFKTDLFTTDTLVEGIHFRNAWMSASNLATKLVEVNLSDIAAMGGSPKHALLNLSLPNDVSQYWIEEFSNSISEICQKHAFPIVGGDTTASPHAIFVNLQLAGEVEPTQVKLRTTAVPGDRIYVSGHLGSARAGLELLENGKKEPKEWIRAQLRPQARLALGKELAKNPHVHAMMDLSDGLANDLPKLLQASQVNATIDPDKIPFDPTLTDLAKESPAIYAAIGGEDYELLFTVAPEGVSQLPSDCSEIGEVIVGSPNDFDPFWKQSLSQRFRHFSE